MPDQSSLMLTETRETSRLVQDVLAQDTALFAEIGAALRACPPRFVATIARGSSDHAAAYGAYLIGLLTGRPGFPLSLSSITRYDAAFCMDDALVLAVSQSGASPDLIQATETVRQAGARVVSVVNAPNSRLAAQADWAIGQRAGPERAIAATKSFILSAVAIVRIIAAWTEDAPLLQALPHLPARLDAAVACDWTNAHRLLDDARGLYVIARGPALPIAREAALKLKEIAYLHAEAVSAAEIQHGPRAVVDDRFPLLAFDLGDPGGADSRAAVASLRQTGAPAILIGHQAGDLPLPPSLHPLLDPLVAMIGFYAFVEALARRRGIDPDRPRGLRKVTETR